eukprot:3936897-Rhodomonas_salina.2
MSSTSRTRGTCASGSSTSTLSRIPATSFLSLKVFSLPSFSDGPSTPRQTQQAMSRKPEISATCPHLRYETDTSARELCAANGIGTSLALFYTSWALAMELKKGMYAEAYAKVCC